MKGDAMIKATSPSPNLDRLNGLAETWSAFARKLITVLARLEEDQFLILSVTRSNRLVQFAAQGSVGMRMETTSNSYLIKTERLGKPDIATLIEAGWHAPTGGPDESTPERDPDGSPNFFVDFKVPVCFESMSSLAVRTLAEILHVPHPGYLQCEAFNHDNGEIALPELGLKRAIRKLSDNEADLSHRLLSTLKEATGLDRLEFDDDGDIAMRYGSAQMFVRLIDDPPYVRIYSPLLREIEPSPAILARLNEINTGLTLLRLIIRNRTIWSVADVPVSPSVGQRVAQVFHNCCVIAGAMGSLLGEKFGGQIAFAESMPSSLKH